MINLFVIGASKCGTTFLHDVLNAHPDICMSTVKEPYLFWGGDYLSKVDKSESLFLLYKGEKYRGESSPIYSETIQFPEVAKRIRDYNPEARIIYLVREPFSRLKSVYRQTLSSGHWVKKKRYARYGVKMPLQYASAVFHYPPFLDATKYWTHVSHYKKYFSDEAIKVVLFEELTNEPLATYLEICRFLAIDDTVRPDYCQAKKNRGEGKEVYNPWPSRLKKTLPKAVLQSVPAGISRRLHEVTFKMLVPEASPMILSAEQELWARSILEREVVGIYRYLGVGDDPWNFFNNR